MKGAVVGRLPGGGWKIGVDRVPAIAVQPAPVGFFDGASWF
jgi:hypothetical protein